MASSTLELGFRYNDSRTKKVKSKMHFNEYLKQCREHSHLTQEQLAEALYLHDIEHFRSLETTTLSKWERAVIKPTLPRQVSIIKYFQQKTGSALPCWEQYTVEEAEAMICSVGMHNLLGKSKELILNFPSNVISIGDLSIYQLRNSAMIDRIVEINVGLDKDFNHDLTQLQSTHFKEWAITPSNSFFVCEYKDQFFGLLFTLRLKPDSFERVMRMEMDERDIGSADFASLNELGYNYLLSFFAMSDKAASMLFIRYYAHLIANQKVIAGVGAGAMMSDAKKLIENMHLSLYHSKELEEGLTLQMYRENLPEFLTSEPVIKMILSKQECPEG